MRRFRGNEWISVKLWIFWQFVRKCYFSFFGQGEEKDSREKVTFSREKVTFSDEKVTFSDEKVTFRIVKVTFLCIKISFSCSLDKGPASI